MVQKVMLVVIVALAAVVGAVALRNANADRAEAPPVVYVCRESGAVFVGPSQSAPVLHPETGRATLWPGVYCPSCDTWGPAPPTERLYRDAALLECPICQTPRTFDGEIPEDAEEL